MRANADIAVVPSNISVVTPSFNSSAHIEATIRSVMLQEPAPLEHIIMDGVSTDGTIDILARYTHLDWRSEPDAGQADALNKALRRTRGEIIAWINADDVYLPDTLAFVQDYFAAHPEIDLVYGEVDWVDETGRFVCHIDTKEFIPEEALFENPITQPAAFFRRSLLVRTGYLRADLHYLMDYEFWWRAYQCCRIAYVPKTLAQFRVSPHSKTSARLERFALEHLRVLDEIFLDVTLQARIGHLRDKAYRRLTWWAGLALYRAGEPETGWNECGKALEQHAILERDPDYAIEAVVFTPFAALQQPIDPDWLERLLSDMAYHGYGTPRFFRAARSRFLVTRGFYYFDQLHDRRQSRSDLLRGILLDAHWLGNRGLWRRLAEAAIPPKFHSTLNQFTRPLLVSGKVTTSPTKKP